jgi:putative redox protein
MKIILKRLNEAVHFEAVNEEGQCVQLDGSEDIGGQGLGMRPMQLVLAALASCSSIDVVVLLKKMRQPLEELQVEVDGQRALDEIPAVFRKIHLKFVLGGSLDEEKVKKAITLSVEKYCSVAKMLEKTAEITWEYQINQNN